MREVQYVSEVFL